MHLTFLNFVIPTSLYPNSWSFFRNLVILMAKVWSTLALSYFSKSIFFTYSFSQSLQPSSQNTQAHNSHGPFNKQLFLMKKIPSIIPNPFAVFYFTQHLSELFHASSLTHKTNLHSHFPVSCSCSSPSFVTDFISSLVQMMLTVTLLFFVTSIMVFRNTSSFPHLSGLHICKRSCYWFICSCVGVCYGLVISASK